MYFQSHYMVVFADVLEEFYIIAVIIAHPKRHFSA